MGEKIAATEPTELTEPSEKALPQQIAAAVDEAVEQYELARSKREECEECLDRAKGKEKILAAQLYGLMESLEPISGRRSVERDGFTYYCNPRLAVNTDGRFLSLVTQLGLESEFTRLAPAKKQISAMIRATINPEKAEKDQDVAQLLEWFRKLEGQANASSDARIDGEILPGVTYLFLDTIGRRKAAQKK